jgi:hypothetical protein
MFSDDVLRGNVCVFVCKYSVPPYPLSLPSLTTAASLPCTHEAAVRVADALFVSQ